MFGHRYRTLALALAVCAALALFSAACQNPPVDPYTAGQQFRQMVDELIQQAQQFARGFCGASPTALILVALAVLGKQAH